MTVCTVPVGEYEASACFLQPAAATVAAPWDLRSRLVLTCICLIQVPKKQWLVGKSSNAQSKRARCLVM